MADARHRNQTAAQGIHGPCRYKFANAVDRAAFANEASGNAHNTLALLTAEAVGCFALQTDNASIWVIQDIGTPGVGPVTWAEVSNTGIVAYSTVQEDGTPLTQRPAFNARNGILATDDAGNNRTNLDLDYGSAGSVANVDAAAASAGVSAQVARIDHKHDVNVGTPIAVTKAANAEGTSDNLARADHKHDVDTAAPGATGVATSSGEGSASTLARSDHTHQSNTAPVDVTKSAAVIGTSGEPARADHKHDISTAAPSTIGTANSEGTASSLARSDHVHNHGNLAGGTLHANAVASSGGSGGSPGFISAIDLEKLGNATVRDGGLYGLPVNVSKSAADYGVIQGVAAAIDHKHDIDTAVPGASIDAGDSASEGVASSLARSDHQHAVTTAAAGDLAAADAGAASAGVGTALPRADHKHQVSTGAPSTTVKTDASSASTGSAATTVRTDAQWLLATAAPTTAVLSDASTADQGAAITSLRSDARFVASTAAPVSIGAANAQGSSTALARADHVHAGVYPVLVWGAETVTPTTVTRYLVPGYGGGTDIPINPVRFYFPRACVLQRMYVAHSQPAGNGNSVVYTFRKNGAATSLSTALASTSSSGSNLVNTVTMAAGDYGDIEVTKASSIATSPAAIVVTIEMAPA